MLALLIIAPDAVLDAASCIIGWHHLVATGRRLLARQCGVVYDRLVVDGVLNDGIAWLLERASKEAALFALPRAPFTATG
jgi:hypothetical protein